MSYIKFNRIYGKNFNSLGEFNLPIIPGRHLVLGDNVMTGGSNGSGKSSLFESTIWTIFKKYARGLDPSFNGKGNCETGIEIDVDGATYNINRYYKHPQFANSVKVEFNGEDVSNRISDSVDSQIEKIIPIPHDLFVSTCVVMQGLPINFTKFTPTIRKAIIEDALGFSVWDDIRKKFTKKIKDLSDIKRQAESKYQTLDREIAEVNSTIEAMVESVKGKSYDLEIHQSLIKKELIEIRDSLIKRSDELKLLLTGYNSLSDLRSNLEKLSKESYVLNTKVDNLLRITREQTCPTCSQDYPQDRMASAKRELKELQPRLEKIRVDISNLTVLIKKVDELDKIVRSTNILFQAKKQELSKINLDIAEQGNSKESEKIAEYRNKLTELSDSINGTSTEIAEHVKNLEYLTFFDSTLLPSSSFRTQVLVKHLAHITEILKSVTQFIFNDVQVTLSVNSKATGVEINIVRDHKTITEKQLSGGELRRLDISLILAFQRFLIEASGTKTNLVVFDEPFDNLDSQGIDSVINCMDSMFSSDISVYVISHNADLKSRFDSVVRVVKESGISRIVA